MIRHFVLLRFRDDVTRETRDELFASLSNLRKHLSGVTGFHAGPNVSVETEMIRGYNDAFWFDFESDEARNAYLEDTEHQAVGTRIVAHTIGGADGVVVVDMEF